jgi:Flagellar hook-length control protein FliK
MAPLIFPQLLMQAMQAIVPLDAVRSGDVVEARVNAMLSRDVARLTLLGTTIDVATPVQLVSGSTLDVTIERTDDQLRLLIRRGGNNSGFFESLGVLAVEETAIGTRSDGRSLLDRHSAIDTALRAAELNSKPPSVDITNPTQVQDQEQPATEITHGLRAYRDVAGQAAEPRALSWGATGPFPDDFAGALLSEPAQQSRADEPARSPPAPVITATIGYLVPGTTSPIDVHIVCEDEERDLHGSGEAPRTVWTVCFSFEPPGLGPVHATVRQGAAGIGVVLSAEQPATLMELDAKLLELRGALIDAALNIDSLAVAHGRPSNPIGDGLHVARTF